MLVLRSYPDGRDYNTACVKRQLHGKGVTSVRPRHRQKTCCPQEAWRLYEDFSKGSLKTRDHIHITFFTVCCHNSTLLGYC